MNQPPLFRTQGILHACNPRHEIAAPVTCPCNIDYHATSLLRPVLSGKAPTAELCHQKIAGECHPMRNVLTALILSVVRSSLFEVLPQLPAHDDELARVTDHQVAMLQPGWHLPLRAHPDCHGVPYPPLHMIFSP
jgi:hypothetical protein